MSIQEFPIPSSTRDFLGLPLVFINNAMETFTPTQSGALATIIWENCCVAKAHGQQPLVITRDAPVKPFNWPNLQLVEYPEIAQDGIGHLARRVERKLGGWRQLGHAEWASRVADIIERADLSHAAFVLINEPEMAVFLRKRFPHSFILHWFQNQHDCKPRFRQLFGRSADVVIAVSDFTARWIELYYGLRPQSVTTVYNAVDIEHFAPADAPPSGKPVIGFVGRTGIEKAPDLLLEAALRLSEKTKDFSLQLVGSNHWDRFELDNYQRMLNGLVTRLENKGIQVRRPGHVGRADLPNELRQAHIHVMPSRWDEPFGMATLEGMACGLATAASRTGGTPEVVADAALLFNRDDVAGLANILERFVRDEALRREYSVRARQRATQLTWERCWTKLSSLLAEPRA